MPTTLGDDDGAREVDLIHEVGDRDVRQNAPMRSISKTVVSQDIAAAIVADAFGPNVALVEFNEATEGWFNAAYRLGLDDGRQAVLKVAPPPEVTVMRYEHDLMATEVAALQLAGERTAIPVPAVLWSDTSCRRVPSSLFVMERCFGVLLSELRPTLDAEQQEHIDAQLAVHLRQLHDITHTGFGLGAPSAPSFDSWGDCFAHLIDDLLADREAKDVDLGIADDRVRSDRRASRLALDEVTVRRFVHWDLWDSNVFIDPETLAVSRGDRLRACIVGRSADGGPVLHEGVRCLVHRCIRLGDGHHRCRARATPALRPLPVPHHGDRRGLSALRRRHGRDHRSATASVTPSVRPG
ncbi:MAG: aminoglycoside phosphotransferase family protein [Acidimicrobiales bacterium]